MVSTVSHTKRLRGYRKGYANRAWTCVDAQHRRQLRDERLNAVETFTFEIV